MTLEVRRAQQDCFCRVCDKKMSRNVTPIVHIYSWRNRGQNIKLCFDCVSEISRLVEEFKLNATAD